MKADEQEAAWHSDIFRSLHVHLLLVKSHLAILYGCRNTYGTLDLSTIARNLLSSSYYLVFTAETAGERGSK
jgi:hypothetical protein